MLIILAEVSVITIPAEKDVGGQTNALIGCPQTTFCCKKKPLSLFKNTFHGLFEPVSEVAGANLNDLFVQGFVLDWYDFESVSQVNLGDLQNSRRAVIQNLFNYMLTFCHGIRIFLLWQS